MKKGKKIIISVFKWLPLIICAAFVLAYFIFGRDITVEDIVSYAPKNLFLAAAFMLFLYAVKSLSIFFPVVVLYFAVGFIFEPLAAIGVNSLGVFVELTIPYLIGRVSGNDYIGAILKKVPKLKEIVDNQKGTPLFMSFFLRAISCLPADAVSIYFGTVKIPYLTFLAGSFLGLFPGLLSATLLGSSITDPTSPMFRISASMTAIIAVSSFVIYRVWRSKRIRNE